MKKIYTLLLFITFFNLSAQVPNYVSTDGLVGWWPFNGDANDESGNGNNGTVNGATLTSDRNSLSDKSYYFDGSNDIVVNNNSISFLNNEISLSTWIYMSNISYDDRIISKDKNDHANRDFTLKITSSGLVQFTVFSSGDNGTTLLSNQQLQSNKWVHLAVTKSQSVIKIFINGILDNSMNASTVIAQTSANLFFGKTSESWSEFFSGNIDDIGIWNRALTQKEITNLFTSVSLCTTYVTINDTIIYNDTNYISINDTITYYDTVSVAVTDTLIINAEISGLNSPNNMNTLKVYPNPANDVVIIDNGDFSLMSAYKLKIVNSLGAEVFNSFVSIPQFQIPVSSIGGNGLYYIQIFDESSSLLTTKKLILK